MNIRHRPRSHKFWAYYKLILPSFSRFRGIFYLFFALSTFAELFHFYAIVICERMRELLTHARARRAGMRAPEALAISRANPPFRDQLVNRVVPGASVQG